jgi:hypothetical protein
MLMEMMISAARKLPRIGPLVAHTSIWLEKT